MDGNMDHEMIIKYIVGVGVIPTMCFALLYGGWKLANRLIDALLLFVDAVQKQGSEAIAKLDELNLAVSQNSCKATPCHATPCTSTASTASTASMAQTHLKPKHS